jgi:NadR type nicotinamide-nucleotide adenylyltransferase
VIGKFYPPHRGHHLLIRTAASVSERVTVVVMGASAESISMTDRVAWLREVHAPETHVTITSILDDVRIDYHDDAVWRAHVELMRTAAQAITAVPIDAVFTSEPYGDELGLRLGARHVLVDQPRALVPVSGTRVRASPIEGWEYLAPPVREALAMRIVLIGAESTGKTTLARRLAERLRDRTGLHATTWVPEYGRERSIEKLAHARAHATLNDLPAPTLADVPWDSQDFIQIAQRQAQRESEAARHRGPLVICDTDAFATGVWHTRYLGNRCAKVEALSAAGHRLYLLTHHDDVPFIQDGLRDGEGIRAWMTQEFENRVVEAGHTFRWLRGVMLESRVECALALVDEHLRHGWGFAAPAG